MGLFGDEDSVNLIAPVKVKGPDGQRLFLGHRTTTTWALLGVRVRDQGYVLVVDGDVHHFYNISPDEIKQYQAQGGLPDPMPTYSLSIGDYLLGYSLWIFIALALGWPLFTSLREKRRQAEAEAKRAANPVSSV